MVAEPKPVAAIVTEYRENSHADLILGRILEGYNYLGTDKPDMKLVSLFTDQVPQNDWSRALAKKHEVMICDSVESAVSRGTNKVSVEGVLIIGENGSYELNEKGQLMYPRRRFFEQTTAAFQKLGPPVPVFNAKHLAANWHDAKWMVDRASELAIPFMAGSVLPLTWRRPRLVLPLGCRISEALAVGYGDLESSGILALEMLQCMVERRRGGESGVREVRYLEGRDVWKIADPPSRLLNAALTCAPHFKAGSPEDNCGSQAAAFVIEYCDGLRATVLMLNGHAEHFGFAARLRGLYPSQTGINGTIAACQFCLQTQRPFAHFDHLVRAIDGMVRSHHTPYPVERTLLTTGILEAVMTSRHERNRPIRTPHLRNLGYDPIDHAFASGPIPS
jgi:hypothetical protein